MNAGKVFAYYHSLGSILARFSDKFLLIPEHFVIGMSGRNFSQLAFDWPLFLGSMLSQYMALSVSQFRFVSYVCQKKM